jgi:hypothetical protein
MGIAPAPIPASLGRQAQRQQHFFSDAPDSFMLVIPVVLEAGDYDEGEGFFVTGAATVLAHLPSYTSSSFVTERTAGSASPSSSRQMPVLPATPVHVHWEAWGAKGARYIPFESSRIVALSGERLMRWERLPSPEKENSRASPSRPMSFVLYDFNQARVRRIQLATANAAPSGRSRTTAAIKNALWPPVEDIPPSLLHESSSLASSSFTSSLSMRGGAKDEMILFDADVDGLPCLRMKWTLDAVASGSSKVRHVLMDESHILVMLVRFSPFFYLLLAVATFVHAGRCAYRSS